MAPSPHGAYWEEGQKLGYQDTGSWTLMKSTPVDRARAAWLYAQFVTSKTTSLKKSHVGLRSFANRFIRDESFTKRSAELGGLVEFYRSPARVQWTPTGTNVPDYPRMAQLWWQNIGDAVSGEKTPQEAMTSLTEAQEKLMQRLERSKRWATAVLNSTSPKGRDYWFAQPGAPKPKLANEKPPGETIDYDKLVEQWQ